MKLKDQIIAGLEHSIRPEYERKIIWCHDYLNTEEMAKSIVNVANLFAEQKRKEAGAEWSGVIESTHVRRAFYKQVADTIMRSP